MTYRCGVRMRGRVGRGAAAVVAAVLLAGCGGSADPAPTTPAPTTPMVTATQELTPEPSEEPTESPEPTETGDSVGLPPLPEAAKENTPEGAEAFIRYYFDVVNALHEAPRSGVLMSIADSGCESCANAEENISWLVDNGGHLEQPLLEIKRLVPLGGGDPGVTRFSAEWATLGNRAVDDEGTVLDEIPAGESTGVFAALWEGERWVFYDASTDPS